MQVFNSIVIFLERVKIECWKQSKKYIRNQGVKRSSRTRNWYFCIKCSNSYWWARVGKQKSPCARENCRIPSTCRSIVFHDRDDRSSMKKMEMVVFFVWLGPIEMKFTDGKLFTIEIGEHERAIRSTWNFLRCFSPIENVTVNRKRVTEKQRGCTLHSSIRVNPVGGINRSGRAERLKLNNDQDYIFGGWRWPFFQGYQNVRRARQVDFSHFHARSCVRVYGIYTNQRIPRPFKLDPSNNPPNVLFDEGTGRIIERFLNGRIKRSDKLLRKTGRWMNDDESIDIPWNV